MVFAPNSDRFISAPAVSADFAYKVSPDAMLITDTTLVKRSVDNDIEAVFRKMTTGINARLPRAE
jgi:hypothetical protein